MANVKRLTLDYSATALTVYAIIRREVDSYRLDDATGSFAASPADPYVTLTEDSVIKGRYENNESRQVWNDGRYTVTVYQQTGGSPSPVADTIIGSGELSIVADTETALLADKTVDLTWDEPVEGVFTARQLVKVMASALAGKASGGGTTTVTFTGVDGVTARITATVDANGNRSAVTINGE